MTKFTVIQEGDLYTVCALRGHQIIVKGPKFESNFSAHMIKCTLNMMRGDEQDAIEEPYLNSFYTHSQRNDMYEGFRWILNYPRGIQCACLAYFENNSLKSQYNFTNGEYLVCENLSEICLAENTVFNLLEGYYRDEKA